LALPFYSRGKISEKDHPLRGGVRRGGERVPRKKVDAVKKKSTLMREKKGGVVVHGYFGLNAGRGIVPKKKKRT